MNSCKLRLIKPVNSLVNQKLKWFYHEINGILQFVYIWLKYSIMLYILQKEHAGIVARKKYILLILSYSSLMKIVCQTEIAFELGYLKKDVFENISKKAKNYR